MAGRPNKYTTNIEPFLTQISILRQNGTDYSIIAKMLNIAESTLYKHMAEIEAFSESRKNSDGQLVLSLEKSLYSLALGTYKQIRTKTVYAEDKKTVKLYEVVEEYGKPDLGANIFALTNLAGDKWSNKQSINLDTNDEIAPSFKDVMNETNT